MCRLKLPEILTHTPCTNRVSSSRFFDEHFGESPALLGLDGGDKPLTEEISPLGWVAIVVTDHQELRGGFDRVETKESSQRVEEGGVFCISPNKVHSRD